MYAEKELKKELYEIKDFLTSLIGSIPAGIIAIDFKGVVIVANQQALKLLGKDLSVNEIIDKELEKYIQDVPQLHDVISEQIKKERKNFVIPAITITRGSSMTYISVNCKIITNGLLLLLADITQMKMADEMKTEFLSIASHELRTPLTAIDGVVSMIRDGEYGPTPDNLKQPLEDVNTSSERLIRLVNDLLNVSRIEQGRLKFTLSDFSITEVVTESVKLLQPIAKDKKLVLEISDIHDTSVQADKDKVKEVLNNLIGNALKFTDRGSITISTKLNEDTLQVLVTDTGIGIGKDDQQKLFGKFVQLESGKGRPVGTGLGLHISKELVVKMGGDLWIEASAVGKGSTFAFSIPKSKSKQADKIKEAVEKEAQEHLDQKSDTM